MYQEQTQTVWMGCNRLLGVPMTDTMLTHALRRHYQVSEERGRHWLPMHDIHAAYQHALVHAG